MNICPRTIYRLTSHRRPSHSMNTIKPITMTGTRSTKFTGWISSLTLRSPTPTHAVEPNVVFEAVSRMLMQQPTKSPSQSGTRLKLTDICYHPPGSVDPLLHNISMELEGNRMGLICGKSGAGKTTLLQVITGLIEQTAGTVSIDSDASTSSTSIEERSSRVGMVFQFPERHFLGHTIRSELTFGWPQTMAAYQSQIHRVQSALTIVGLTSFDVETPTINLSDGFKRRLALAVQLVRQPSVLLLDEPLAGLDWKARGDMIRTLERLKHCCTILVISHDLRELKPLVDVAWRMDNGRLLPIQWP